ncbi:MAG TPA: hypothetical protein VJX92_13605 [Methylomirabilota bacterium]|nr:hypothetical protein [Methylomirabilota bacterium]
MLVLTLIALALVALAAPVAFAQPAAPKVTINGLIDNVTSYSENIANYNTGIFNRKDKEWYGRTRGRFDIIGEVGKAKAVLGLELDEVYGLTGNAESNFTNGGGATGSAVAPTIYSGLGSDGSFGLNTDVRGQLEIKWLYVEFPVPLIPVPTTARVGAQPFGTASTFKVCTFTCSDFAGLNVTSQVTPNVKVLATYVQVEEDIVGPQSRTGLPFFQSGGASNTQSRGDDFAYILSPEISVFKGFDIKPMVSMFYANGPTYSGSRQGRGGINTSTAFTNADGTERGGINEYRYTVGLDGKLRMGPFSFDPSVMYQFGNRAVVTPANTAGASPITDSGANPGQVRYARLDAWFIDLRAGYQLGPLLIEALGMYTTGNSSRNNTLGHVRYFQPLTTDTGYLADWGTSLSSLGIDYLNAWNEGGGRIPYPGVSIGWDKYGRAQLGAKATYALTPALSAMAGANAHWTAEKIDRNSIPVAGAGLAPVYGTDPNSGNRGTSRFVGTELMALLTWRFADGLSWDNQFGYMFLGKAMDAVTDPLAGGRNTNNPFMLTSRVRFTF